MYKPGDTVAEVALHPLQVCAGRGRNHFSTIGNSITINAKQHGWGFNVFLRKKFKSKTLTFKVYTGTCRRKFEYLSLQCPKCQKFGRWMYLDWDTLTGICKKCYGLPQTWKNHHHPARWMKTDYHMFQRLFKKRIALFVAGMTMKNIRSMNVEQFFSTHPYLVPPFFEMIAQYDMNLYRKSLQKLLNIYRRGVYLWKFQKLSDAENDWLDRHLAEKVSGEYGILKGESEWMKENLLKPSGTKQALSTLPPSETASSSSKTPSSQDTNALPAEERPRSAAMTARDLEATQGTETTSSAPVVAEAGKSPAEIATAREVYLSFLNNHKGDLPPGVSYPPETK